MIVGRRTTATIIIAGLGVTIGAAVLPFLFGLLGAPILAATFGPLHDWLLRRTGPRRAAALVVTAGVVAIFLPVIGVSVLIFGELPGVLASPEVDRLIANLATLHIGPIEFGGQLAAASSDFAGWLSRQALALIGSLSFVAVNLLIAFLGLYFLLREGPRPWQFARRYLPFSDESSERRSTPSRSGLE